MFGYQRLCYALASGQLTVIILVIRLGVESGKLSFIGVHNL